MSDEVIFLIVVALRLGIPLLIPRFALPAIVASLVIDAADQTIFQNNTDLNLDSYQSYDKALDVYYLTIAYLSTVRNWQSPFAFRTAQALWYYRLAGVLLFEITGVRALLLIFPNTFEYFFIAYEAVRTKWNPLRMSHRQIIKLAAIIWIFIKLPQEWWIHIAQLDFTDFMKDDIFGVPVDASWGTAISENLWFVGLVVVVVVGAGLALRLLKPRIPEPDWPFGVDVDAHLDHSVIIPPPQPDWQPVLSWYMFEKVALVAAVSTIFALVLPDSDLSFLSVVAPVAFIIVVNAFASTWLARQGHTWNTTFTEFCAMAAVNVVSALVFIALVRQSDSTVNEAAAVFFVLLLTLIVTIFDRFHRSEAGEKVVV